MTQEEIKSKLRQLKDKWADPNYGVGKTQSQLEFEKKFDRLRYRSFLNQLKEASGVSKESTTERVLDTLVQFTATEGYMGVSFIADKAGVAFAEARQALNDLKEKGLVLEFEGKDTWAVTLRTRQEHEEAHKVPGTPPTSISQTGSSLPTDIHNDQEILLETTP